MSEHGSSTVVTQKGDPTKILEPNNFDKLFNLFFLQNHYSAAQPLGPHSLLSTICLHGAVSRNSCLTVHTTL